MLVFEVLEAEVLVVVGCGGRGARFRGVWRQEVLFAVRRGTTLAWAGWGAL